MYSRTSLNVLEIVGYSSICLQYQYNVVMDKLFLVDLITYNKCTLTYSCFVGNFTNNWNKCAHMDSSYLSKNDNYKINQKHGLPNRREVGCSEMKELRARSNIQLNDVEMC